MQELPSDLRAALLASPDDLETCLVCGDWLQGAGDPQGELIALQARRLADPGDRALRLAESRVRDVTPILELPLEELVVRETPIDDAQLDTVRQRRPGLRVTRFW
jgi:uncharacterized protein (TIGR02996 family)